MKKSRQQTIRPNIIVLRPHEIYNFKWVPLEALGPVIRPQLQDNKPDQYGTRLPVFRLKNIGSGPAMHIQIKWNIEGNTAGAIDKSNILKKYNPHISDNCLMITNNGSGYGLSFSDAQTTSIDYCISSSSTDFVEPMIIPNGIEGSYEIQLITGDRPLSAGTMQPPKINLFIEYEDYEGKGYKKLFIIESRLNYLPDTTSSNDNPIKSEHFSSDNLRGYILFSVKEMRN